MTVESQVSLTEWQRAQLVGVPEEGVKCLVAAWTQFAAENHDPEETFCNAIYDGVNCWGPSKPGNLIRSCTQVFEAAPDLGVEPGSVVTGNAYRVCTGNGSWLHGNWTNYTECAENIDDPPASGRNLTSLEEDPAKEAVRYILFCGSAISLIFLCSALFLFFYFKSLRCDRITLHIHLMTALCFRFSLLIVVTEPVIFEREDNYRSVDTLCKVVISLLMYSTVAAINWMFVQGHYLHGRLTHNIFDRGTPFKTYYAIGWGVPLVLVLIWASVMETHYEKHCWEGMADLPYIWIIVAPMIAAVLVNLLFLINIVRVLLTKIQRSSAITEVVQFRRAVKATLVLFPLLGVGNLLFVYNPGGSYEKYYMLAYTILQASQGIFVSILYCFMSTDVRDAIRREWLKFRIRRNAAAGGAGGGNTGTSIFHAASARISRNQRNKSFTAATATSIMMVSPRSTPGSAYKVEAPCLQGGGRGSCDFPRPPNIVVGSADENDLNRCEITPTHPVTVTYSGRNGKSETISSAIAQPGEQHELEVNKRPNGNGVTTKIPVKDGVASEMIVNGIASGIV